MPAIEKRDSNTRKAYAEWLQGYHWDYFLTSTFRSPRIEPYYALKGVWNELRKSNVFRGFLVAEPHQSGDLHIHGLVAGRGGSWQPVIDLPLDIYAGLFKRFGRAKVEAVNSRELVSSYCAKYLLKQQSRVCDYYELFGNKNAWKDGVDNIP